MKRWSVTPLHGSLGRHAAAWDRLNVRHFGDHPLLTSLFVNGLLAEFSEGNEYLCYLEPDGGAKGEIAAMCILKARNRLLWCSFLPSQAQIAATLIADPSLLESLSLSLPRSVIQLDLLCNDTQLGALLSQAPPRRHLLNHALTMNVALDGGFDAYWASRSKQLQSNIKKRAKRLDDDGVQARYLLLDDPVDMLNAVDRFADLECAGWKGRNGTAVGSIPEQHRFYRKLMLDAAHQGNAFVAELWFGDTLAASRLMLRQRGMVVILKTSYDESYAVYSPGRLQLRDVIERWFARGDATSVEFYTDADENQLEWATGQRWIRHRTVYRSALAEAMAVVLRIVRTERAPPEQFKVEVFGHADALPADVQSAMLKAEKRNVGFGLAWYRNLTDTVYAGSDEIRYYTLRRAQHVLAVLPLRVEKIALGYRLHALSNFYTSLYEPVMDPGLKSAEFVPLLGAIEADFPGMASLSLAPMDRDGHAYHTILGALRLKAWIGFEYYTFANWYQPVRGDWPAYLAGRDSNLQNTLRRMGKKFGADQGRLEIVSNPKDMPMAIAAYEKVYAASWKKPEPFPDFMPGLLQTYAAKGFLRVGIAWLGETPVAAQIWIVAHGRAEIFKLAFDNDFKAYSPGSLLSARLMQHVFEVDQVQEVDYLSGDDAYKKSWMSDRRERWGLVAYKPSTVRGVSGILWQSGGLAVRALRNAMS